ncbi:MAG: bifunctional metallophosphatase/5'-nucleotidase [Ignavibacteria bacterium]|jgi:2',3'-cyclic-nucleotide 2'-phosphodiesterase/3'-nucleotidase|nr:bifunctional metallophosphatase/5'-nucleotidase [Ignavibacteria bacterium]MCU7504948.1 bifunctional metallophosphatase/5'-nucleotidase [Ignavibacteria bacterium]MCU7514918.1 bifunctional metallophosphatase/5'-nucleotidase [Ignavibacteria bacterium]
MKKYIPGKTFLSVLFILNILISTLSVAQTVKLKIIETSDVHGAIFPFDFRNNKPSGTSLAQVCSYVRQERNNKDQQVVLLDNGDILQGQPVVYYYNFEKTSLPHILSQAMNFMQYDAASVGNHDIETGHPVYDRVNREFNFPWMAANAVDKKTGQPYFKPYAIIERNGVKIAVLGLITPAIPNWLPEKIWAGMEFEDMIQTAAKWVKIIKEKEKPDLIVGLFHSGVEYNYNNQTADMPKNENASELVAERVAGFDVIFTGHDHKIWNKSIQNPEGKGILLLGPNNDARTVATADLVLNYDKPSHSWKKESAKGEIIEIRNYKPDEEFMQKFTPAMQEVKDYVAKPIGNFTETISTRESMFGDSPFMDLIHSIQLDLTKADVSFAAPLSFDTKIDKGDVYVRDMFKLYKFENLLYTMELTGKEIKGFLEHSYSLWFNQMKDSSDHLINFKLDENGKPAKNARDNIYELKAPYYNFDCAAGIIYTVDVSKPEGQRVNIISMADGSPFDMNKTYKAAVNSYRGNGGGGHLVEGAKIPKDELSKRIINSTEKDLRFYLMKWIEKEKTVKPAAFGNWKVIPEEWYQKGKEKDFKLLYNSRHSD